MIGDNPNGPGEVAIRISDGLIVSAGEVVNDPLGNEVVVDRNKEHWIGQEDHPDSLEEIKNVVRNPDEIWESGNNRIYVKYIDGEWVVVRAFLLDGVWGVSTAYYEGQDYGEVQDTLEERDYDIPDDKIYEDN